MTRRGTFLLLIFVSVTCLILAGCSESTKPKPHGCDGSNCLLPRTSSAAVLQDLRVIYSVMDNNVTTPADAHALAAKYRELFHPDFKFYFLPEDTPPDHLEGWWGRDNEAAAFDSLVTKRARGIVDEIQLSWSVGTAVPDDRVTDPPPPESPQLLHPDWMHTHVTSILLDIIEGDMTYRLSNAVADFYFAPDPADSTLWLITEWYDRQTPGSLPSQSRGSFSVSPAPVGGGWGRFKYLFSQ